MQNQKYLLPIGFYDLLGDEARINQETINSLLNSFYESGYQLIKTPLAEFEESLENRKTRRKSFKMVDNLSGKTLVMRSDITPQIARLVATKLQNAPTPIKLCYVGDVLKTKTDNLYADRQLTQVGIELVGKDPTLSSCSANSQIIELTLSSLKKVGLSGLMINFCCPGFLDILINNLNTKNTCELKAAIISKNISKIQTLGGQNKDDLTYLALENSDFSQISKIIAKLGASKEVLDQLDKWQKTIISTQKNHPEIEFSVDIFGDDDFYYHQKIGFTIFANNFSYPIARGGRYLINQEIPAVGSTIYISNLRKILTK
ncbi:MAG: ATP phosphoribosyltransferase regulatory subunit [Rickettsiales bacterium]|jgi:ATP phosphoribosyltransferase regulatory subunit